MARKELNIFGISFLDLLSGALGAVLILFIIIPKITVEQQEAIEQLEQLHVQAGDLNDLLEQARNSIPITLYEQIEAQMEELQHTINGLNRHVQQMQARVTTLERENRRLQEELEEAQRQLEEARRELAQRQAQERNISEGKIFGTDAKLGVVCTWSENIDVDLYVKNLSTDEVCCYNHSHTPFGTLMEDVQSRRGADDNRYEVIYQKEIVPGKYLIYVNIYRKASLDHARSATVTGFVVLFPGSSRQQKIDFRQIYLTVPGQDVNVGTLEVTNTNIYLIP
ncbi:MAG: hypothetical protein LBP56_07080 [Odoribacteraceae bacterium]|jgi:DNA gyrase/topoisomerase IV subunit A|nr:hypothetical protein [Odoribacteraceae bacterium]